MATCLCLGNLTGEHKCGIIWYVFLKYKSDIRHSIVLHVAAECIIHAERYTFIVFCVIGF